MEKWKKNELISNNHIIEKHRLSARFVPFDGPLDPHDTFTGMLLRDEAFKSFFGFRVKIRRIDPLSIFS
jgi:hypothetical protein